MSIQKNTPNQKLGIFAYNEYFGTGVINDENNITAQISIDFGASAALNDLHPAPLDDTNHPGVYVFDLTQGETSGNVLMITPSSSGTNVLIDPIQVFTIPSGFNTFDVSDINSLVDKLQSMIEVV